MKAAKAATSNLSLREARERRAWTQEEVAQQIGTNPFTVYRWERGVVLPSAYFQRKLCALFQMQPQELGFGSRGGTQEPTAAPTPSQPVTLFSALPPVLPVAGGPVGREQVLETLRARLCAPQRPAVALRGLPGVGKTTLAAALAQDPALRAHFSDGIFWGGLGPTPSVSTVLNGWGAALGIAPEALAQITRVSQLSQAVHAALGMKKVLLIIDDAWQSEDALALQVGGPHCAHLLTTRFVPIAAHFAPEHVVLVEELDERDSLTLLARLAPEVVAQEEQQARTLVQAVGGLPLALTLVGHFLHVQAVHGQPRRVRMALERLHQAEARLRLSEPTAPAEHPLHLALDTPLSLRATIAASTQQLSETGYTLLGDLALFPAKPNSFSEEAAYAVSGLPMETFFDHLDSLMDAGLVEGVTAERYTLHQTIVDAMRLESARVPAITRLVVYYTSFAEAHRDDFLRLDQEHNNMLAALEYAHQQEMGTALMRGAEASAAFWQARGLYEIAASHLRRAEAVARAQADTALLVALLIRLGWMWKNRGDFVQAEAAGREGLTLARESHQETLIVDALHLLGTLALLRGDSSAAEAQMKEGAALARRIGYQKRLVTILANLGAVAANKGDLIQAEAAFREAVEVIRSLGGGASVLGVCLENLGVMRRRGGAYAQAQGYFEEALQVARQQWNRRHLCQVLANLGELRLLQGAYELAEHRLQEALSIARDIENPVSVCSVLTIMSELALERGTVSQARGYLQEGLAIAQKVGHRESLCEVEKGLAQVALAEGNLEQALSWAQSSVGLARAIHYPWNLGQSLIVLGDAWLGQAQADAANTAFREVLEMAQILESQDLKAGTLYGLARAALAAGQASQARTYGEESLALFEYMGHVLAGKVRRWLEMISQPPPKRAAGGSAKFW